MSGVVLHCVFLRAQSYAERLRLGLAVIHGEAQCSESDMADGRHSPPCVRNTTGHTGLELPCKSAPLQDIYTNIHDVLTYCSSELGASFFVRMWSESPRRDFTSAQCSHLAALIVGNLLTVLMQLFSALTCFRAVDSALSHSCHQPYSKETDFLHYCMS